MIKKKDLIKLSFVSALCFLVLIGCSQPTASVPDIAVPDIAISFDQYEIYLPMVMTRSTPATVAINFGKDVVLPLRISEPSRHISVIFADDFSFMTIEPKEEGFTSITLSDENNNTSKPIAITISKNDLRLTLTPSTTNMKANDTIELNVTKGADIGELSVTTDNPAAVSVAFNTSGEKVIVKGIGRIAGSASVTITDSNTLKTAVAQLTIDPLDLNLHLSPSTAKMKANDTIELNVTKGVDTGKLTVTTDNPAAISVAFNASGDKVIVKGIGRDAATATVTITDSNAKRVADRTATAVITLTALDLNLSLSPLTSTMKANDTIELNITKGADIGELSVTTNNPAAISVALNKLGDKVIVKGIGRIAGSASVTITDSKTLKIAVAQLTIDPLDLRLSLDRVMPLPLKAPQAIFSISTIGTDIVQPLTLDDYDNSIATVSIEGNNIRIIPIKRGDVNIKIKDANGVESNIAKIEVLDIVSSTPPSRIHLRVGEVGTHTFTLTGEDAKRSSTSRTGGFTHTSYLMGPHADGSYSLTVTVTATAVGANWSVYLWGGARGNQPSSSLVSTLNVVVTP